MSLEEIVYCLLDLYYSRIQDLLVINAEELLYTPKILKKQKVFFIKCFVT